MTIKKVEGVVASVSTGDGTPEECCERAGVTLDKVYRRLGELLDATTLVKMGYEQMEVADNRTRMAAVQLILELRRHIKDKSVVTQVGIFNDPKVVEEAERVLRLRGGA
jgi:hypothetical protein